MLRLDWTGTFAGGDCGPPVPVVPVKVPPLAEEERQRKRATAADRGDSSPCCGACCLPPPLLVVELFLRSRDGELQRIGVE